MVWFGNRDTVTVDIVDDFERSSLDHYSGDTGDYDITTNQSFNGERALELTDASGFKRIYSNSGLENYPTKGSRFKFYFRANAFPGTFDPTFGWAVSDTDDSDRWYVIMDTPDSEFQLVEMTDSGGFIRDRFDVTWETDVWYEADITWDDGSGSLTGTNDNIVYTLTDTSTDTEIGTGSYASDSFSSNTGIRTSLGDDMGADDSLWLDYWHIVETA